MHGERTSSWKPSFSTYLLNISYVPISVPVQLCPTLCIPMDCSTPGFPVHHQLPELAQTDVHQVGDAIQPSHPLSSPSPPALNLPSIRVFSKELLLHIRWLKYWSFSFNISPSNEYSGLISFKIDWLNLFAVQGTLKSINSSVLRFHCSSTLTSIHDYWKNHFCASTYLILVIIIQVNWIRRGEAPCPWQLSSCVARRSRRCAT